LNDKELQNVGETVARKRGRPVGSGGNERPDSTAQPDPGDNTKYITFALMLRALPEVDMTSVEEVSQRATKYFELCAEYDMKPGAAGLALAFGKDRTTLWKYRDGSLGKNEDVRNTLKKAVQILDLAMESYMQNGKINPVSGIFLMKNNLGYVDKQEVTVTAQSPLGDTKDIKALEEKYGESVADE
jgi:hypothetical protein